MSSIERTDSIDQAHAYRLQRLGRLLRYQLLRALAPFALTPEQFVILFRLHEQDGQVQKELVDDVFDDRANITHLVNQLTAAGHVRRERHETDGRQRRVFLTESGRERFDSVLKHALEVRAELFSDFTDDELDQLMTFVARIEERIGSMV
ncbi:MAG: MarR family transcriptional regulator [Myxococcales bacterium]|nr:MarR family transcriptional regulator [Myxococcales bacterium]